MDSCLFRTAVGIALYLVSHDPRNSEEIMEDLKVDYIR